MTDTNSTRRHQLYRYYDLSHRLLYVGVSASAIARLTAHRNTASWYDDFRMMTVDNYPSRAALLEAERKAIIAERPLYNVVHRASDSPRQPVEGLTEREILAALDRLDAECAAAADSKGWHNCPSERAE